MRRFCTQAVKGQQKKSAKVLGTYDFQAKLPRLPVPPLDHTLETLLLTMRPLTDADTLDEVARMGFAFIKDPKSLKLQKYLEDRSKSQPNWLEQWWDRAYLDGRCSPMETNYYLELDTSQVKPILTNQTREDLAARLIARSVELYLKIKK